MRHAASLLSDRPLTEADDDLLGFEPIADGLAGQLRGTVDGGILTGILAPGRGFGRSSFLNLLQRALLARGVTPLRISGGPGLEAAWHRAPALPGLPPPLLLVDDADPAQLGALRLRLGDPGLVVAWVPDREHVGRARELSPLLVELPRWCGRSADRLATALGATEGDERQLWIHLLATAGSPRRARRLANAALAAAAAGRWEAPEVLAALARVIGLDGLARFDLDAHLPADDQDLLEHVARFAAGIDVAPAPAALGAAEATASEAVGADDPDLPSGGPTAPDPGDDPRREHDDPDGAFDPRRRRCLELSRRGDPEAIDELIQLLGDAHPAVRLSASHALASLGDRTAVPALRPLLSSPDASLRRSAAFVLGRIGDEGSRDDLVRLLADSSPEVRRASAAALGHLGDETAARPLLFALEDGHAGVRMTAETALSRLMAILPDQVLDELLDDPDPACRRAAVLAAGRLGFGSRDALERLLTTEPDVAARAAEALGRRRERDALPALARTVAAQAREAREAALAAIARITDGPAAEGLASLLASEDEDESDAAREALAHCPGAFEAVLPYLSEGKEDVRSRAADALGRTGDRRAVAPLLAAHDSASPPLRRAAAASLVRLGLDV